MNDIFLSIIIPAFNEESRIGATLIRIKSYFKTKNLLYEVIVVDDGSTDSTVDSVKMHASEFTLFHVLENKKNKGKGYSVNRGMLHANGAYRLFMDADGSVDISHFDSFLEQTKQGHDIVIGSIGLKDSTIVENCGSYRRFLGSLSNKLIRLLAVPGIHDTQRGFKLFSASAAEKVFTKQTISRFGFDIEILVIAWLNRHKIKEMPVSWNNPTGSKVTYFSYIQTLTELTRITFNRILGKYTFYPSHVALDGGAYHSLKNKEAFGSEQNKERYPLMFLSKSLFALAGKLKIWKIKINSQFRNLLTDTNIQEYDGKIKFEYQGKEFAHFSTLYHSDMAFYVITKYQKIVLILALSSAVMAFYYDWHGSLIILFSMLTALYFIDLLFSAYIAYRALHLFPEIKASAGELALVSREMWPKYTILCPLYKEWQVVPQFIDAMKALDYPAEKLQIMFLLEEDDTKTKMKIDESMLPSHFETVIVPRSLPKTKPKAMNFGIQKARGEYLVVYDAEDIPNPNQLKKAVIAFKKVEEKVICVQAKLNFYNPRQNLLTHLFTAEYSLWFDLILPGLQSINAPLPLGGTSNHFRINKLREIGGWDAFNVTEDCDLGMRLSRRGYRTAMVDSTTFEEANSNLLNWYKQRSRWIKGYIQTYLVHMRKPLALIRNGNVKDLLLFQLIVGGKVVSLFVNPIMWLITISYFMFRSQTGAFIETLFPGPILFMGVFSLLIGNFLAIYYYMIGCFKRQYYGMIKYAFIVPFYWLGMSVAAWKALYEIIVKPYYWAKTVHGLHLKPAVLKKTPVGESVWSGFEFLKTGGATLVIASASANFINFIFNAYLGRTLTLEEFGVVTIMSTFAYLLSVFTNALGTTVTHVTSFLEGVLSKTGGSFFKNTWFPVFLSATILSVVWLVSAVSIAKFFQVSNILIVIAFAPAIIFSGLDSLNRGYLQGTWSFAKVAVIIFVEVISKLLVVIYLVQFKHYEYAALAIPISLTIAWFTSTIFASRLVNNSITTTNQKQKFPLGFYFASFVTGISVISFLSIDVILAKHYLTPDDAGRYSMLSVVGKMIYFFGSLLNIFMITLVSRSVSLGQNPKLPFRKIFMGTTLLTTTGAVCLTIFGSILIPFLLGKNSISIIKFIPEYAISITLFTLSTTIVLYQLARKRFIFPVISLAMVTAMILGIASSHSNIESIISILLSVNIFYFIIVSMMHLLQDAMSYIYKNIRDLFLIFKPLPAAESPLPGNIRILIFNWRDRENVFAGGSETYIHNLAKRWVQRGHSVTLFTSNDGNQTHNGDLDGMRIIRRGGFYGVYVAAFFYYLFLFRGKYDIIIDCENGIPFFTPLYVKEPVYCLVHHIHQDVFRRSLVFPLSTIALFLEKRMMPLIYRNCNFITVSDSSRRDMIKLNITKKEISVIYPGVDLDKLAPGEKSSTPLISYVGRLKNYKSLDVLLRAYAKIVLNFPDSKLIIAGDGDERATLISLAKELNIADEVSFPGRISESRKREILSRSWVSAYPSMMEGWGITAIEANACGTPVVASNVPGLRDSVQHGKTGILVPYGNADQLAKNIELLLTDKSLRDTLSSNALIWASNFRWETSSEVFMKIIIDRKFPDLVLTTSIVE